MVLVGQLVQYPRHHIRISSLIYWDGCRRLSPIATVRRRGIPTLIRASGRSSRLVRIPSTSLILWELANLTGTIDVIPCEIWNSREPAAFLALKYINMGSPMYVTLKNIRMCNLSPVRGLITVQIRTPARLEMMP